MFWQKERVLVLLVEPESDDLACMMVNIKMDINVFISTYRFASGGHVGKTAKKNIGKSILKLYFKYSSSILQYTSSILQPVEL